MDDTELKARVTALQMGPLSGRCWLFQMSKRWVLKSVGRVTQTAIPMTHTATPFKPFPER